MPKLISRTEKNPKSRPSPLDRRSGIPLYQQIQQRLLDQIRSGELVPGEPLPSIERIAARMGVSLMTVRQAVRELCELGVIYSRQGKGTFIAATKLERDFRQVLSFTEETVARGGRPSSAVLFFGTQEPTPQTREALNLTEGEKVLTLRRIRLSDAVPMGIECSSLPISLCPDLHETFDPTGSLYTELAERHGIQLVVTDEIIEVGKATAEESRLLQIAAGSAVFLFTRVSYLENGSPAEYVKSVYPGDRYKVVNRLTRMKRDLTGGQGSPLLKTTAVGR
jgi:GntR family transcriptional regulator